MNGKHLKRITDGQGDNPLWHAVRKSRITASVFYQVYTKVQSIKKKLTLNYERLVNSLLNPTSLDRVSKMESEAKAAMEKLCHGRILM